MFLTELLPRFDSRQSFYGKALIRENRAKQQTELYSYQTHVATVHHDTRTVTLRSYWDYSPTTLRHVKEFLRQNGFKAETKKQLQEEYLT